MARVRVDIYESGGAKKVGKGPLPVISAEWSETLDETGQFRFSVPIPTELDQHSLPTSGQEAWFNVEDEGLCYRGIITGITLNGTLNTAEVKGRGLGDLLNREVTPLGMIVDRTNVGAGVRLVLGVDTVSGWDTTSIGIARRSIGTFDTTTHFEAVRSIAESALAHMRFDTVTAAPAKKLDVFVPNPTPVMTFASSEGTVIADNLDIVPISNIKIETKDENLWTGVFPYAGGQPPTMLSLRDASTKTRKYDIRISSRVYRKFHYIENDAATTKYGRRIKSLEVYHLSEADLSNEQRVAQSDLLYEIAEAWLDYHSELREELTVDIAGGLEQVKNGSYLWRVGDSVKIDYRGDSIQRNTTRVIESYTRFISRNGGSTYIVKLTEPRPILTERNIMNLIRTAGDLKLGLQAIFDRTKTTASGSARYEESPRIITSSFVPTSRVETTNITIPLTGRIVNSPVTLTIRWKFYLSVPWYRAFSGIYSDAGFRTYRGVGWAERIFFQVDGVNVIIPEGINRMNTNYSGNDYRDKTGTLSGTEKNDGPPNIQSPTNMPYSATETDAEGFPDIQTLKLNTNPSGNSTVVTVTYDPYWMDTRYFPQNSLMSIAGAPEPAGWSETRLAWNPPENCAFLVGSPAASGGVLVHVTAEALTTSYLDW